jgi:prevent-host-death family protein
VSEQVEVDAAIATFEDLVDRAASGEEIVIARDGRPIARLVSEN